MGGKSGLPCEKEKGIRWMKVPIEIGNASLNIRHKEGDKHE